MLAVEGYIDIAWNSCNDKADYHGGGHKENNPSERFEWFDHVNSCGSNDYRSEALGA